jgi:hypothetical protein
MSLKFHLEPYSQIPPHVQIIDRIKLALLVGELQPGDTLPSIRDVEIVHTELSYPNNQALARRAHKLCLESLEKAAAALFEGNPKHSRRNPKQIPMTKAPNPTL